MTGAIPLLYDSVSPNTGDVAIGIAGQQVLAGLGFDAAPTSPFASMPSATTIVGGGELLRASGDPFYDRFRVPGTHILNASGVWTSADDLDYLREYAFVSARSTVEAEVLSRVVPDVQVVPCTTTLLTSDDYAIPGVQQGEPVVGIHIAPHAVRLIDDLVDVLRAIPYRKVLLPFTHYIDDASFMRALGLDQGDVITLGSLGPLEAHAAIRGMKFLVATSLHASLFAYTQNVPFAVIAQRKVSYYFNDRDLADHVISTGRGLADHVHRLVEDPPDYAPLIAKDRAAVADAYTRYAEILRANQSPQTLWAPSPLSIETRLSMATFLEQQTRGVIRDRDLTIAHLEARRQHLSHALRVLQSRARNRIAARVGRVLRSFSR